MVVPTNYPERLDKALIRPGRIDLTFHFGLVTKDQMKEIFLRMYYDDDDDDDDDDGKKPEALFKMLRTGHVSVVIRRLVHHS